VVVGLLLTGLLVDGSRSVRAERPSTASLLPDTTAILLWIPDAPDAAVRFMNTALGRISRDPQIRPLVDQFCRSLAESVEAEGGGIGMALAELLALPHGEVALAVVAPKESEPALVVLVDVGNLTNAKKLLRLVSRGAVRFEQSFLGTRIGAFDLPGAGERQMKFFGKDAVLVFGTNVDVLQEVLLAWNDRDRSTLADNKKFAAIMRRSRVQNAKPQFAWYFDPIMLMQNVSQTEPGVRMTLMMASMLGLDGLKACGGATELDAGEMDTITHFHMLLESPRDGVLEVLALTSGETTPERWVPADVSTYTTLHLDVATTLGALRTVYDRFAGEGAFSDLLARQIGEPFGLDIESDLLPALTGRVTHVTRIERPATVRGNATALAWELKKKADVGPILKKVLVTNDVFLMRQRHDGKEYFEFSPPEIGEVDPESPSLPRPCFGLLDDYLIITDGPSLYRTLIATSNGSLDRLADAADFKRVAREIRNRSGPAKPAMVRFVRPEEDMRWIYDLLASDQTRQLLSKQAERNLFSHALNAALESQPLPPFDVLGKHLAPGGGLLTVDDEGIHYTGTTLRPRSQESP
jgi:hypothetical protein